MYHTKEFRTDDRLVQIAPGTTCGSPRSAPVRFDSSLPSVRLRQPSQTTASRPTEGLTLTGLLDSALGGRTRAQDAHRANVTALCSEPRPASGIAYRLTTSRYDFKCFIHKRMRESRTGTSFPLPQYKGGVMAVSVRLALSQDPPLAGNDPSGLSSPSKG
jgi:hypothetical protein